MPKKIRDAKKQGVWVARRTQKLIDDMKILSDGRLEALEGIVEVLLREEMRARQQEERAAKKMEIAQARARNDTLARSRSPRGAPVDAIASQKTQASLEEAVRRVIADHPVVKNALDAAVAVARASVPPAWLAPEDAASYLGVSRGWFYKGIMPRLEVRKLGRRTLVEYASLQKFIQQAPVQPGEGRRSRNGSNDFHNAPGAPHAFVPKVGVPKPDNWEIAFIAITPRNLKEDTRRVSDEVRALYKQVVGQDAPLAV